jgi:peroxiredoxin
MRPNLHLTSLSLLAALWAGCASLHPPPISDASLPAPPDKAERTYLGLAADANTFKLEDIQCEMLVVDFFDMYCHVCQSGAKHMDALYHLVQDRGLGHRIKFVGIGVGDTPLEVAMFKDKLHVPFPVFPDRQAVIARQYGDIRVPSVVALVHRDGRFEVIHRSIGLPEHPEEFLEHLQSQVAHPEASRQSRADRFNSATCAGPPGHCTQSDLRLSKVTAVH